VVGYAGSPTCIVHADVTLARSHGNDCQPPSGPLFVCLCVVVYSVCSGTESVYVTPLKRTLASFP